MSNFQFTHYNGSLRESLAILQYHENTLVSLQSNRLVVSKILMQSMTISKESAVIIHKLDG